MGDQPNKQIGQHSLLQALGRRVRNLLAVIGVLLIATAATAYFRLGGDRLLQLARDTAVPTATAVDARDDASVAPTDFQSFERQTAELIRSVQGDIGAQQADLKRLSDQVSALAARIESPPSAVSMTPAQSVGLARPLEIAARKKPPVNRGIGISVGSSPLPPAAIPR